MTKNRKPWVIINQKEVYDNPWIKVIDHKVISPTGHETQYGKVHFKNKAIGIIPIDDDGFIWLVGQQRFPLNSYSWEIPEGGCLFNENSVDAAKRELKEETGIVAKEWKEIIQFNTSNSVCDEEAILFIATNLTLGISSPDATEDLEIMKTSVTELFDMVQTGRIKDSLTVVAAYHLEMLRLKELL